MKRPITVSRREPDADGTEYDLVCGQGRLEACRALGATEIPAIVTTAAREEQLLMGLVENVARRSYSPADLIAEVRNQRQRGVKTEEISRKLDLEQSYISGIIHLLDHGEERLIRKVESGHVALTVAMQIASSDDAEIQRALSEAYQDKSLRGTT